MPSAPEAYLATVRGLNRCSVSYDLDNLGSQTNSLALVLAESLAVYADCHVSNRSCKVASVDGPANVVQVAQRGAGTVSQPEKITYTRVQDATLCSESKMMDGVVMKWSSHLNKATNASRESLLVTLASAASTQLTGIGHFCT